MKLEDVKIDGSTTYHCRKIGKNCTIEASFTSDGAALVARDAGEGNFLDLWTTEACYLSPKKSSRKTMIFYEVMCGRVLAQTVSFIKDTDYDVNALKELVMAGTKAHPDRSVPVSAFNRLHVLSDKTEALKIARNQVAAYRVWIYEHLDNYGGLLEDLKQ